MSKYTVQQAQTIVSRLLQQKEDRISSIREKGKLMSAKEKVYIEEEQVLIDATRFLIKDAVNINIGKLPPMALDLEESVLGAIILESKSAGVREVMPILKASHFYTETHQRIYTAIVDLVSKNAPVDIRTVVNELRKKGWIEIIGGPVMIAEITSKVSSAANVEYHARILIEYAMKRYLIMLGQRILFEGYDDGIDVFDLLEGVEDRINTIKTENIKPLVNT
jgi:replicative DNA helicase